MQNTDVYKTYADITELGKLTGYYPTKKNSGWAEIIFGLV